MNSEPKIGEAGNIEGLYELAAFQGKNGQLCLSAYPHLASDEFIIRREASGNAPDLP